MSTRFSHVDCHRLYVYLQSSLRNFTAGAPQWINPVTRLAIDSCEAVGFKKCVTKRFSARLLTYAYCILPLSSISCNILLFFFCGFCDRWSTVLLISTARLEHNTYI